ncbi:uncharacterized protein BJ212DRAFT_1305919 [Suillus subaureus]|uniref:Uncharacterized protein n=1 Tax=Suillus subaureus TaxID=48587 RepID=A0A9P7DL90_9AGAM|nr:uncharacterized protein BJ212DRAFT_1305919 [Suillus subaureus]KAG1797651.1 hypothetical protein BJ212DRAFT_1305919 [Suillus subaureus]
MTLIIWITLSHLKNVDFEDFPPDDSDLKVPPDVPCMPPDDEPHLPPDNEPCLPPDEPHSNTAPNNGCYHPPDEPHLPPDGLPRGEDHPFPPEPPTPPWQNPLKALDFDQLLQSAQLLHLQHDMGFICALQQASLDDEVGLTGEDLEQL